MTPKSLYIRASFFVAASGMVALGLLALRPASAQTATSAPAPATEPANKPAIFLIGDSTIRNGTNDNGATAGQFGWGHLLHYYIDTSRIYVVNDAMGGTSSRSYQTSATLWKLVLPRIQPGDYVLMAFGHNDSTASIKGNGEETQPLTGRGAAAGEVMHSFGWYMRQYIEQTKAKGATPIVLSLIPRNRWTNGKVGRNTNDYALWAKQAAEQEHVEFIPLNDILADKYDKLGQEKVSGTLFPLATNGTPETVHPNWAGAKFNAECVVEGIKGLKDSPLKQYLLENPKAPDTPDVKPPAKGEMGPPALGPVGRPVAATVPATTAAPAEK